VPEGFAVVSDDGIHKLLACLNPVARAFSRCVTVQQLLEKLQLQKKINWAGHLYLLVAAHRLSISAWQGPQQSQKAGGPTGGDDSPSSLL